MSAKQLFPDNSVGAADRNAALPIEPLAVLLRGFAVEFLTSKQWTVLPKIMASDYVLNVGGHVLGGREKQYRTAMLPQFEQFPGLCVTVHDVVFGIDRMAMRFTEHGASRRDSGRQAAWQGVALFRVDGGQLVVGWAEEDYFARKRQLRTGVCDTIEAPHPAPWDTHVMGPDAAAEACARDWLLDAHSIVDALSDVGQTEDPPAASLIAVKTTQIDEIFSAGDRVAFHATHHGTYKGGFPGVRSSVVGTPVALHVAGILTVRAGTVVASQLVTDRLGLQRALRSH